MHFFKVDFAAFLALLLHGASMNRSTLGGSLNVPMCNQITWFSLRHADESLHVRKAEFLWDILVRTICLSLACLNVSQSWLSQWVLSWSVLSMSWCLDLIIVSIFWVSVPNVSVSVQMTLIVSVSVSVSLDCLSLNFLSHPLPKCLTETVLFSLWDFCLRVPGLQRRMPLQMVISLSIQNSKTAISNSMTVQKLQWQWKIQLIFGPATGASSCKRNSFAKTKFCQLKQHNSCASFRTLEKLFCCALSNSVTAPWWLMRVLTLRNQRGEARDAALTPKCWPILNEPKFQHFHTAWCNFHEMFVPLTSTHPNQKKQKMR